MTHQWISVQSVVFGQDKKSKYCWTCHLSRETIHFYCWFVFVSLELEEGFCLFLRFLFCLRSQGQNWCQYLGYILFFGLITFFCPYSKLTQLTFGMFKSILWSSPPLLTLKENERDFFWVPQKPSQWSPHMGGILRRVLSEIYIIHGDYLGCSFLKLIVR